MNFVIIWSRRYHDNTVLIRADRCAGDGYLYVGFAVDRQMQNRYFRVDCNAVRAKCKKTSNGRLTCYVVPASMLEDLGEDIPAVMKPEIEYQRKEYYRRYGYGGGAV